MRYTRTVKLASIRYTRSEFSRCGTFAIYLHKKFLRCVIARCAASLLSGETHHRNFGRGHVPQSAVLGERADCVADRAYSIANGNWSCLGRFCEVAARRSVRAATSCIPPPDRTLTPSTFQPNPGNAGFPARGSTRVPLLSAPASHHLRADEAMRGATSPSQSQRLYVSPIARQGG